MNSLVTMVVRPEPGVGRAYIVLHISPVELRSLSPSVRHELIKFCKVMSKFGAMKLLVNAC